MDNSPYHQLDKLIDEYEEDSRIIKTDKLIMVNYPKVYVMTVTSTFEKQIKLCCQNFIDYPLIPLTPCLSTLMQSCARKNMPITDAMYGKFYTFNRNTNTINFDTTKFYDFWGGITFRNSVETVFETELASRLEKYQNIVDGLLPLLESGEHYEREYAKNIDIRDRLLCCTFVSSEKAFLELKLRRNKVAHDYMNGLSDSFENIRDFYLDAVLYISSLEKAIVDITDIDAVL